ncbi:LysR family transcriptional regulator [Piscinibacter sp. HJYY11]|uniref:LysR family transcriptional regulator n=1 Tax=Piscinibacter sp. HJYY11 TaxID=2801333 RepID=UPI00191E4892|nr:LysR family transcriptional regulator [Piscinibacter sp. HJYY11]MBL0730079.1 LysR family transcriptional regulator [Piscinibacter sp. HJYY11]
MNSNFDWSLVRSFIAALEHGSLMGAARAIGASQPTLSRHIAELESQLGAVLFERTGRGLQPTSAALRLADAARVMQGGADQLSRALAADEADERGTVRLSASQPVACFLLPPLLAQMRLALPQVQVALVSSNSVSNLLRREADIALRMVQPEQASLIAKRVGRVTLGAYAHRDYLARRGTPRQPGDLQHHDLIAGDQDEQVLQGLRGAGLDVDKVVFALRSDDLVVHWQAVRAGLGVGFVADYVAATDAAVTPLLPMLRVPPLPLWLVVHREIRSNRRIRAVYDFLAQALARAL